VCQSIATSPAQDPATLACSLQDQITHDRPAK
jgi:hypothetical protein